MYKEAEASRSREGPAPGIVPLSRFLGAGTSGQPRRWERPGADALRKAPYNLEAEQALLGAILIDNGALSRVSGFLQSRHFFDPLHQQEVVASVERSLGPRHHAP